MGVKKDWEIVDIRNNQIVAVKYCLRLQITPLTNDYLLEQLTLHRLVIVDKDLKKGKQDSNKSESEF